MAPQIRDVGISFCIPVYNVKAYLEACIESIYAQGISNFEIICVDDCSTDGSREELERIAENRREIVVLRNDANSGIGYSRNRAIRRSAGKYIWFVDADDMLVPNSAGLYLDIAEKTGADAVLGKCMGFTDSTEALPAFTGSDSCKMVDFSDPDQYYSIGRTGYPCFGVWVGIFRRAFLMENEVYFHEEIRALEEFTFYVEFGVKAKRVASVDHYGYYYRVRPASASHGKESLKNVPEAAKTVLPAMKRLCERYPAYERSIRVNMAKITKYAEYCLAHSPDTQYVRATLGFLKEQGFYPHSLGDSAYLLRDGSRRKWILSRAWRIEPCFWAIHYACKFRGFLRKQRWK